LQPDHPSIRLHEFRSGATVKIFAADGTVTVAHGGCEIGQGINTKIAQVAAFALGCDLSIIRVVPTDTSKVANNTCTGESATSESSAQAVMDACKTLAARLSPFMQTGKTWSDAVADAANARVNLMADGWFAPTNEPPAAAPLSQMFTYFTWSAACTMVEIDVLTGEVGIII
jgi:xanthine dehydrogenase/oxidase